MYYMNGSLGGAKVNLECKMNYQEIQVDSFASPSYQLPLDKEWSLTSRYDDTVATVSIRTAGNDDRRVVISTLLAGLKLIEDSDIYSASVAVLETKLGFQVDRDISSDIAQITDTVLWSDRVEYEIYIGKMVNANYLKEPKFHLEHLIDKEKIRIVMEIEVNYQKLKAALEIDEFAWSADQHQCLEYSKQMLLKEFYKNKPELSSYFSYMKYFMYEEEMKSVSLESKHIAMSEWQYAGQTSEFIIDDAPNGYQAYKPGGYVNSAASMHLTPKSSEDRRVKQLPALDEMVKHPVTGQTAALRDVIINLNDISKWTREAIADWLETLDIDISFKTKENNEQD